MTWLLAMLTAIAFVEILLALPLMPTLARLLATARRAHSVVGSPRISDHWKEKTLVVYAGRLLRHSLKISGLLTLAFALIAAGSYLMAQTLEGGFIEFMLSVEGTVFVTVVSLGYVFARSRLVPRQL